MRHLGQRVEPPQTGGSARLPATSTTSSRLRRLKAIVALAGGLFGVLVAGGADALEVKIQGRPEKGFGRIELTFDKTTKVRLGNNGTILVIDFGEPTRIKAEDLESNLPTYVSTTRRDPDGTAIRLALSRPFRASQLEAGERVFIDLLPERWAGLPPGLPPQVVAELAERARVAEEKLRAESGRRVVPPRPVTLRLAQTSDQTRLVLEPPLGTPMRFEDKDGRAELRLDGRLSLDLADNRPKAAAGIAAFDVVQDDGGLTVSVAAKPGRMLRAFLDEGTAVFDLVAPEPTPPSPAAATAAPIPAVSETPAKAAAPAPRADPPSPREPDPLPRETRVPEPFILPPAEASAPAGAPVRPRQVKAGEEAGLLIPFQRPASAAAFERGARTMVVFRTDERIEIDSLVSDVREAVGLRNLRQMGGFAVLTLDTRPGRPLRLSQESEGWRLAFGGEATPPDDVLVTRAGGQDGRGEVKVGLAGAAVHWLIDVDDVPLAIVTTSARQGLANPRRFVEFQLLPTLQGLAVQPSADGVRVALGRGGVLVTRGAGLALSTVGQPGAVSDRHPFVIRADEWESESAGDSLSRYRDFVRAAADAPRSAKTTIRFNMAKMMVANGMAHEAMSVLAGTAVDDPLFARRREALLLSGIAAARARRPKEARAALQDETLGTDPEAAVWRAGLDAEAGDWERALAGLRRAEPVLMRYPDELVGDFRLKIIRAAAATGDVKTAEEALAAIERLPPGTVERDAIDFARATIDEAAGRASPAHIAYERLSETASRPIQAAATLRAVMLGRRTARLPAAEATRRLENLAVSWRGDEIELGTIAQLVKLYGEAKRWRDLLTVARFANLRYPNADETRRIYAEAAGQFEALFAGRDGDAIDAVQFLALYYDFKEFAPVGRRGDEIVRRIADRLVEIDLIEQAASLLQHQVEHRLTGIGRVTIGTRLAALRLMSGKPGLALAMLAGTRMSELPAPLRRLRVMIEAQAQADLSRVDLALEAVEGEQGADFARLRATIQFGAKRWREAGEAYEQLLGTRWKEAEPLSDEERQDVIRAMLADILAKEDIALERIRAKFSAKMADSPDAKLFEALLRPRALQSPDFRVAFREASRSDTLRSFLGDWSRVSALPDEPPPPPGKAARAKTAAGPG